MKVAYFGVSELHILLNGIKSSGKLLILVSENWVGLK